MEFKDQRENELAKIMFEVLQGMQSPNLVCDSNGLILFANKRYLSLAGGISKKNPFWKIYPLTSIPSYFRNAVEKDIETNSEITFKENSFIVHVIPIKTIFTKRIYMVYFEDITIQIALGNELINKQKLLEKSFLDTILTICEIIESRDAYTYGHQKRVALLAVNIAVQAKILDLNTLNSIYYGALIHDIGKIAIPIEYLVTPKRLTKDEYEIIKYHVHIGYKIIEHMHFPCDIKSVIAQHHERLDGSGYPNSLKGEAITIPAKIVAIADTYEAMSTNRPYRTSIPPATIFQYLEEGKGQLFESYYIECFFKCFSELNNLYQINSYYQNLSLSNFS
jgi:putative nucleotidyltransferase with HDIG domain